MNNLFVMEAVNMFCQDVTVSDNSQHLTISELKLPGLEENYSDHLPGGATVAIEIDLNIQRLEATFILAGWQPEVMTVLRKPQNTFTAYGAIRDRRAGTVQQAKAIMQGRLGRVNPTNFRKGDVLHHEYSIRSITHYELYMGGTRIYLWDFFLNQFIVGGTDVNADVNNALGLTGIAGT